MDTTKDGDATLLVFLVILLLLVLLVLLLLFVLVLLLLVLLLVLGRGCALATAAWGTSARLTSARRGSDSLKMYFKKLLQSKLGFLLTQIGSY